MPAVLHYKICSDDFRNIPVATFNEKIWLHGFDEFDWCGVAENTDCANAFESCENFCAVLFDLYGAIGAFAESFDTGVAVDSDDEEVAEGACVLQVANVTDVEEVEDSVSENELSGIANGIAVFFELIEFKYFVCHRCAARLKAFILCTSLCLIVFLRCLVPSKY